MSPISVTIVKAYVTDVRASLRISDRDSAGRFVKGNRYRFAKEQVTVCGQSKTFLTQNPKAGNYFRAL